MNECVFCKIVKKEIPANIVYKDDHFLAFLDIKPINCGHTLLIPKTHYENLYVLPDDVLSSIAPLIKKLAIAVKKGMNADGINIGMNNESTAGQVVPHAHIHIIPRFANDGLLHWPGKSYASKEEIASLTEKIKNELT